jgi:serine/threonine protein kinase, bacterial
VLKLPAGASSPIVLPFPGLVDAHGLAVDDTGAVYIVDRRSNYDSRVVKLAAGATQPEVLPSSGLEGGNNVAVDSAGAVYVADTVAGKVVKLTPR